MSEEEYDNTIEDVLNYKVAKKYTDKNVKVEIKKGKKGVSLFAKKQIKKGNVIAYYKFKVYNEKNFEGINDNMYSIAVYTKSGRISKKYMGDIYEGSLEMPKRGISFLAYFANEPNFDQHENCFLDINLKNNYRNKNSVKEGDTMIYKLVTKRNIKKGEEIVWCYGNSYERNYEANCDD